MLSAAWDALVFQVEKRLPIHQASDSTPILLYVCELVPARAGRLAKWVRRQQALPVYILCHRAGYVPEFVEGNFDQVYRYRNAWHLRRMLRRLPPLQAIHAFAPKCQYPELVRSSTEVPFFLDMQDVLVTYHGLTPPYAWARRELPFERNCLAEADVMIAQSLEARSAYLQYGISPRPKTLYFPLFCDEDAFQPVDEQPLPEEIHLVYAGGLAGSHRDRVQFGILQFHDLIEHLSEQGIHFHVYPSPSTLPPDYEEYRGIAHRNPHFHLHDPVPNHALTQELAQYHFGILPFFREDSELKQSKMTYSTSLKLYNFLEAGLPVIISRDIHYQAWIIDRGEAGYLISKSDVPKLKQQLQALNYPQLRMQVARYREKLALGKQIPKILALYEAPPP